MIAVTIYITRKAAKILHKEGTKAMATAVGKGTKPAYCRNIGPTTCTQA